MVGNVSEYGRIPARRRVHPGAVNDAMPPRSHGYASTPLGRVVLVAAEGRLVGLTFDGHSRSPGTRGGGSGSDEILSAAGLQLDEYFRGVRTRFELPIRLLGSPFQVEVWSALLDIPYGSTSTYGLLAERIGRPRAARAVGAANGRNPISIVVPCHRLVGADGGLTGYGWGLDRKRSLLALEGADPGPRPAAGALRRSGR
jgi:methylated-DNA-[protein]-cysteine S-methyltransferase